MTTDAAILSLIADLYSQIQAQRTRIEELEKEQPE